jgi:hypothetical protein
MPSFITTPTIRITTPTGPKTINNPFYQYKFQTFPLDSNLFPLNAYDGYLAKFSQTTRDPNSIGGSPNIARINAALAGGNLKANTVNDPKPTMHEEFGLTC